MTRSDWPDIAGRLTDFGHVLPVRVYFEDTDFSGMVYHASYLRFMERGRSDFLRLAGVSHEALARGDVTVGPKPGLQPISGGGGTPLAFAVARMTIDFKKPARIDDVLAVETRVKEISAAVIKLAQVVRREASPLVAADVSVVLLNPAGRPQRIPKDVGEWLALRQARS
jgi:acyl-CoA thioester hydrolase